jgi:3-dehydroquinate synthase
VSELTITSSAGRYDVEIAEGGFAALVAELPEDTFIVADDFFRDRIEGRVVWISAEERLKTVSEGERLLGELREAGARRSSHLVAVGGGIVQDLATFAAQQFMRGIRWTYVPTTLLGMADSCIGGKSSLNVGRFKNLAGSYFPPERVLVDPEFIATLPAEDVAGGLAEAAKITFCRGPEAFAQHRRDYDGFPDSAAVLLHHTLAAKQWFIEIDEFDRAERRLLNFGHTFGHALEAGTTFAVSHGAGVALGVRCAIALTRERGEADEHADELDAHCVRLLDRVPDLAQRLGTLDRAVFERAFKGDKKHTQDEFHVILPAPGGGAREVALPATDDTMLAVHRAVSATVGDA